MSCFETVLIANRGEIACRIIRTLREMGLRSVAVYSDADANALHVKLADQAVHIGASPAAQSYLDIEKILSAAKASGAQAVHPGYGFLSENAEFAQACADAGIAFIGPSPDAISAMGDKAVAKRRMIAAGVPCVPGYQGEAQDDGTLLKQAEAIGFPVMVKAAAGGGGRGMRLATHAKDLPAALADARTESQAAFGNDMLILERAVQRPRHVEVQIFGDTQGHIIHLGERDCSVQRRHQKMIEEAPCPILTPDLRARMGAAAVAAAQSVDYVGAGTVEFLLDADGAFYFLEMNTRLQVEHPVTEMITGLDLVALQIRIAQGEALGMTQPDIQLDGHAIEVRLYAEDPAQDFLPSTGTLARFACPDGAGIRTDSGVETGGVVSPFYDPMLAKIIAHGPDRETARRRVLRALETTTVFGVATNRDALIQMLNADPFIDGQATTAFLSESDLDLSPALNEKQLALAAVSQFQISRDRAARRGTSMSVPSDLLNWCTATPLATPYVYGEHRVEVTPSGRHSYRARVGDTTFEIACTSRAGDRAVFNIAGEAHMIRTLAPDDAALYIDFGGRQAHLSNAVQMRVAAHSTQGVGDIRAPMHGTLVELFIAVGDVVKAGDRLGLLEAMKMQHEILADIDGVVETLHAKAGDQVAGGAALFEIKSA